MVNFGEIIGASVEWTTAMLFRPFRLKKWLILTFIALLAGQLAGGCNSNLNLPSGGTPETKQETVSGANTTVAQPAQTQPEELPNPLEIFKQAKPAAKVLFVFLALLAVILMLVLWWLSCRFQFIFLRDISLNDVSLKIPFRENKKAGNSLFKFSLVFVFTLLLSFGLVVGAAVFLMFKAGVFQAAGSGIAKGLLIASPFVLLLIGLLVSSVIVGVIAYTFAVIIMYKEKINFLQAWPKAVKTAQANKLATFLYCLIYFGLALLGGLASALIAILVLLGLLLPILLLTGLFIALYKIFPANLQVVYYVILWSVVIPAGLLLWFLFLNLYLPVGVFLRTFSLKFVGRVAPEYDLFRNTRP